MFLQESIRFWVVDRRTTRRSLDAVSFTVLVGAEPAFGGNASAWPQNSSHLIKSKNSIIMNETEGEKLLVLEFHPKQAMTRERINTSFEHSE